MIDLGKEFEVRAALPGIEEKDIDLEILDRTMTIRTEKRAEKTKGENGGRHPVSERRYGKSEPMLRSPDTFNPEKADAKFRNGVLTVTFPKTKRAKRKPKKIAVKSA